MTNKTQGTPSPHSPPLSHSPSLSLPPIHSLSRTPWATVSCAWRSPPRALRLSPASCPPPVATDALTRHGPQPQPPSATALTSTPRAPRRRSRRSAATLTRSTTYVSASPRRPRGATIRGQRACPRHHHFLTLEPCSIQHHAGRLPHGDAVHRAPHARRAVCRGRRRRHLWQAVLLRPGVSLSFFFGRRSLPVEGAVSHLFLPPPLSPPPPTARPATLLTPRLSSLYVGHVASSLFSVAPPLPFAQAHAPPNSCRAFPISPRPASRT